MSAERNEKKNIVQWERADRALREATRRTIKQYQELELPIAVEKDGQVVWVDPSGIEIPSPDGPGGFVLQREIEAANRDVARVWIRSNCPIIFTMLKGSPEPVVPAGLLAYLSPRHHVETAGLQLDDLGTLYLVKAEEALRVLRQTAGDHELAKIGKRLAAVGSEEELVQMLCEISVCASVGNIAERGTLRLEPSTGQGSCDLSAQVADIEIWGEVKRYADTWAEKPLSERPASRALSVRSYREAPDSLRSARSRAEVLRSKLDGDGGKKRGVPEQFLSDELNVLFLFEDAWTPLPHVRAALLGDKYYFRDPSPGEACPDADGLFAIRRWEIVSACCWMTARGPLASTQGLWLNPNAIKPLPASIVSALLGLGR